ncbi:MAG: cation:proton antiporter [Peptococcaceae bacterium]|nr:cation:proton antiporter [Peptococcaceae bacterium]
MQYSLFLEIGLAIAIVALAGLISFRMRFSIVPVLILAGLAVGPHLPVIGIFNLQFTEIKPLINFMGRLGVLFLLFYLGLEFSLGRLMKAGPSIIKGGTIYIIINFTLGIGFPLLMGWPLRESLVAAGVTTISSSAIVAKLIVDLKRSVRAETEMILGLMMYQDVFIAIYLSVVSGLLLTGATSPISILKSAVIAIGFMASFILVGRKLVPFLNRILRTQSDEVFMLVVFAILTLVAGFSESIHVAEAVGALLAGLILAETEHVERIEVIVVPFRDFFGAIFFFSFGLSINPTGLAGAIWPALGAVLLTILGNFSAGMIAGRNSGYSHKASTNIGLTITSRGEFSIILAGLAATAGLMPILQPFVALYVLLLAILGPLMTKESKLIYSVLSPIFKWPLPKKSPRHKSSDLEV